MLPVSERPSPLLHSSPSLPPCFPSPPPVLPYPLHFSSYLLSPPSSPLPAPLSLLSLLPSSSSPFPSTSTSAVLSPLLLWVPADCPVNLTSPGLGQAWPGHPRGLNLGRELLWGEKQRLVRAGQREKEEVFWCRWSCPLCPRRINSHLVPRRPPLGSQAEFRAAAFVSWG